MARHKSALALLACALLLVTVISAFRLRDLSDKEVTSRSDPVLGKCTDCGSDDREKPQSVSSFKVKVKLSYEDIKNAVREKQRMINERKQLHPHKQTPPNFYLQESDDDNDDKRLKSSNHVGVSKAIHRDDSKHNQGGIYRSIASPTRSQHPSKKSLKLESDEENNDSDGNGDGDDEDESSDDGNIDHSDGNHDKREANSDGDDDGSEEDVDDDDDDDDDQSDDDGSDADKKTANKDDELSDDDDDDKLSEAGETDADEEISSKDDGQSDDDKDDANSDDDDDKKESDGERIKSNNINIVKSDEKLKQVNLKNTQYQPVKTTASAKMSGSTNLKITKTHPVDREDDDSDKEVEEDGDEISDDDKVKITASSKSKSVEKTNSNKLQEKDNDGTDDVEDDDEDDDDDDDESDYGEEINVVITKTPKVDTKKTQKSEKTSSKTILQKSAPKHIEVSPAVQLKVTKKEAAKTEKKDEVNRPNTDKHERKDSVFEQYKTKESERNKDKKTEAKKEKDTKTQTVIKKEKESTAKEETEVEKNYKGKDIPSHARKELELKIIQREKEALERASEALFRKNNFIQSEFEDFYAFLPSFAPNFSRVHNAECRRHGQILMRQLRATKLWALNMLDASGKVSSGILDGNANQLGNMKQCLSSRARVRLDSGHVVKIHGKYCLAQLDLRTDQPDLQLPVHLAQARNLLKSKIDDPGHFIPRFSSLNWGVCLPEACEAEDAEFVLRDTLRHYHLAGIGIKVNVEPVNCHTDTDDDWESWLDPPTLATMSLFLVMALLVAFATLKDFFATRSSGELEQEATKEKDETEDNAENAEIDEVDGGKQSRGGEDEGIISSFSLYRSCGKLLRPGDSEDVACIHGIRAICSLCLLLAHKTIPVANTPFLNRGQLTELSHEAVSIPLRLGWLYTDAFLLLSGALTAHRLSADADSETSPSWFRRYVARYVRLTPALIFCVLFYAYVWEHTGRGPLWGTLVTQNARLCQNSWWWNLLYLQNFLSFDEMCAPQTYQLAVDMQLTLFAAALVWALRKRPLQAAGVLTALQAFAAYLRHSATEEHRLTLLIYHGASVSQLYRTANLTYTSTLHRCTPYVVGVVLGVLLQRRPRTKLSLWLATPCWFTWALCCAGVTYPALEAADAHHRYSAASAAVYAALAPPVAAAALTWLIYVAHSGNAEWLNRMLQARTLVLVSRLSYAMYLCQFVVFFTNAATVSASQEFSIFSILDLKELAMILAASTAITLTLVIPMQSLSKYVMSHEFGAKEETSEETTQEVQETTEDIKQDEDEQGNTEMKELQDRYKSYDGTKILAHREALEEIAEAEYEYESQRDARNEGLEEILEEEEDELADEEVGEEELAPEEELGDEELQEEEADNTEGEEDMEFVERVDVEEPEGDIREAEGGEHDFWGHVQEEEVYVPRRLSREDDAEEPCDWRGGQGSRLSRYR